MTEKNTYTRRAALALLGSGSALAVSGTGGYTSLITTRSASLSIGESITITDRRRNNIGASNFGNFNPLDSAGTTYLSVTNNSNSSATVTASNSSVTVTDTNGTTNPSVSGGGTLDIEVSHSAGSDQTSTLEFTDGNQTVSTPSSVAIPVAPSNAVARYSLAGNTNDVWGSNNGSSPSSSYVTGANQTYDTGDAISLDSDVLDLVDSVSSGQTYTAWVKPASDETRFTFDIGWHYNVDKGYGVRFYPGKTRIYPGNSGTGYDPTISFGAWNHVAMVDDGSSITLYIDGQKELTVSQTPANGYENTGFLINTEEKQGEIYDTQTGDVDDVRVYDTALTDDEVADLYNTGHISP